MYSSDLCQRVPLEWLHPLVRKQALILQALAAFLHVSASWFYASPALSYQVVAPSCCARFAMIGFLWACKLTPRIFELSIVIANIATLCIHCLISPSLDPHHLWMLFVISSTWLVLSGTRLHVYVYVSIFKAVFVLCCTQRQGKVVDTRALYAGGLVALTTACIGGALIHTFVLELYQVQRAVKVEKEAFSALLGVISDSYCWLAPDSSEVCSSSPSLDSMMGRSMVGVDLCMCMPPKEADRFLEYTVGVAAVGSRPVGQLHTEVFIEGCDRARRANLFIVDRRSPDGPKQGGLLVAFCMDGLAEGDARQGGTCSLDMQDSPASPDNAEEETPARFHCFEGDLILSTAETASIPETLGSVPRRRIPRVHNCSWEELEAAASGFAAGFSFPSVLRPRARETLVSAIRLMSGYARGGALLAIADTEAFQEVFGPEIPSIPVSTETPSIPFGRSRTSTCQKPTARHCDEGYITERLRGVHISQEYFALTFQEFTEHSDTDRWPLDHPDPAARGKPKDGAWLLSSTGYRLKCAAKLLGLSPPVSVENVGTRHEAALATAWAVRDSFVLVRSDAGSVRLVLRMGAELHIFMVCGSVERGESDSWLARPREKVTLVDGLPPDNLKSGALSLGESSRDTELAPCSGPRRRVQLSSSANDGSPTSTE